MSNKIFPVLFPIYDMINVGNKEGYKRSLNARRKKIMDEMRNNPNITQEELVKIIGIKSTAIEDNIKFLKENEYIERKGSKKQVIGWDILIRISKN